MGLDIMLYHFSEPKIDTSKKYTLQELDDLDLNSITIENNDREHILNDYLIENFAVEVEIEKDYWNFKELYKLFQEKYPDLYPNDYEQTNFSPHNVGSSASKDQITQSFTDYSQKIKNHPYGESPQLTISAKDYSEWNHLIIKKFKPAYVYKTKEIDYQRKGLNDYGWSLLPDNCCYSTNKENVELMVKDGGLSKSFINKWVDGKTAIMGWW